MIYLLFREKRSAQISRVWVYVGYSKNGILGAGVAMC